MTIEELKKSVNPVDKEKKTILDFCYALFGQGLISLKKWLKINGFKQEKFGLVNISHVKNVYGIHYDSDDNFGYKGILRKNNATTVLLSSIPKGENR